MKSPPNHPANTLPLVNAALICESAEKDPEGWNISFVRDTTRVTRVDGHQGTTFDIPVTIFLRLKAGAFHGTGTVTFVVKTASGETHTFSDEREFQFLGDEHGLNVVTEIAVPLGFGVHWFDILWNGRFLTSTPLCVQDSKEPPRFEGRLEE